ncbi:hypothetical protein Tco_1154116 [Tanacetum coccineum]
MLPTLFACIDKDVRKLYTRSGVVRDEIFSQRYKFMSLELEQERIAMKFGALWRPVLALEAWPGHVDTRIVDISWAGYDDHRLVHDMLVHQAALQRELQEIRGRVTALEQERDRRERSLGESEETPLEETDSLEGQCISWGMGLPYGCSRLRDSTLVRAGDQTSGDARSGYMISEDAKSWLSDDQLFIKALEEFKPSIYGENYEEENENATHGTPLRKGNNLSKNLRLTKLHIMIGTNLQMMKRKHDVDAFNTLYYTCLNENNKGGILEDVPEVNKNAAGVIIESFVNDVSNDAALDETMIHNRVNGKSVNHVTQPDGTVNHNDDIKSTTNDQLNEQIDQKVEQNEEVVPKCFNPSSRSTSAIHEPKVERRPFDDKLSELVDDSSKIREQKYDDKPLNKESESRNVIFNLQENLSRQLPCLTPKMIQNLKKPPFLIPDMTLPHLETIPSSSTNTT